MYQHTTYTIQNTKVYYNESKGSLTPNQISKVFRIEFYKNTHGGDPQVLLQITQLYT